MNQLSRGAGQLSNKVSHPELEYSQLEVIWHNQRKQLSHSMNTKRKLQKFNENTAEKNACSFPFI